jgi:hypothetical protein
MNETDEKSNYGNYTTDQVEHFLNKIKLLRNAQPSIQLDLSLLAEQLTVERAKTYANEAMGRRLPVIERTVLNIYDIFPPNRSEFLSKSECTDIAIQLHAFAINVYAILDNAAWISMLQAGANLVPVKVGLFKKECQALLPRGIVDYISSSNIKQWFNNYGKTYRDSTAHRIPPYLPSRTYTPEEGELWNELNKESMSHLYNYKLGESFEEVNERLGRHEQLEAEKDALGRNSYMIALTLSSEDASNPVFLHPQLLCDWGLVQEFVSIFTKTMREHYGWKAPYIPDMVVV